MKKIILFLISSLFLLGACKSNISKDMIPNRITESNKLNAFFQKTYDEDVAESPMQQTRLGIKTEDYGKWDDISEKNRDKKLKINKERLAFLEDSINVDLLDKTTLLSYKLAKENLQNDISDFKYRLHNYPLNQMFGWHSSIPAFLINMHKISNISDAEACISRLQKTTILFSQVEDELKLRAEKGIMPPKFVFDLVINDCENILSGSPFNKTTNDNLLIEDFKNKINALAINSHQKTSLTQEANDALLKHVKPAYTSLIALLKTQKEKATTEIGAWKLPGGKAFYNAALQRTTTTNMTSDEIHELGLSEVQRIHNDMRNIMNTVGFKGDLQAFFTFMKDSEQFYYPNTPEGKKAYLAEAASLIETMKSRLDELFITKPRADIEVKAVEAFREKSAGKAFYQRGTPDGSRPGIFYANLYDMKSMPTYQMEALAYHEGIPGHHMQLSIAQEMDNLPMFRKFAYYTAYSEGWGLYTELLPKEIGMYSDPYSNFGRLAMELWRACRLVVDTGIHDKKWTRTQAISFYIENTPNAKLDAVKMVERHIVMPSQATAYKIGMNKILNLRTDAKTRLKDKFDIREFHEVVLSNGLVPLNVLEDLVDEWIVSKLD
ncbi:DUF885 family protein [Mariniflexile ostreae]|uniref:DUF885 family protein n=1 Tax=Mariniflexile ostreae TaxID=1520892 RepID=A0ABV5FDK1_9FLAO